ncbi:MAG: ATP-binding protein [Lachnospiraceae bacterium]|nr:ATP-binding protein [Lachnospiraceae bacterium]
MWEIWSKISYMVQILAACGLFWAPAKKRSHRYIRLVASVLFFLAFSWILTGFHATDDPGELSLQFWVLYIFSAVGFIWFNLESSLLEALYAGICGCGIQHIAFDFYMLILMIVNQDASMALNSEQPGLWGGMISVIIYAAVYAVAYFFFSSKLVERGHYRVHRDAVIPLATMILLIWVISILELSSLSGFEAGIYNHIIYRIMDALCCFYVLWVQINQKDKLSLIRELDGINAAARQQQMQYQMTSETIDSINRKCHDMKHQIRALRHQTDEKELQEYLNEIENDVMIYDVALKTGNKALDTVLMEKGLFCKEHNIQWSCMVDGTKLDFMKLEDIYAIFGNALDNAVRAVMALKEDEKKVISVKILEQNQLLMIQIQNYYEGELKFQDGLPVTTRKNTRDHGFGMKSIRHTAEKYNGIITVQARDHMFMLQILIPAGFSNRH